MATEAEANETARRRRSFDRGGRAVSRSVRQSVSRAGL